MTEAVDKDASLAPENVRQTTRKPPPVKLRTVRILTVLPPNLAFWLVAQACSNPMPRRRAVPERSRPMRSIPHFCLRQEAPAFREVSSARSYCEERGKPTQRHISIVDSVRGNSRRRGRPLAGKGSHGSARANRSSSSSVRSANRESGRTDLCTATINLAGRVAFTE
jgi:hypothetical protein